MPKKPKIAAIFDLDGTLIPGYAGAALLGYYWRRLGLKPLYMAATPAILAAYKFGLLSRATMVALGATTIEGLPVSHLERAAQKALHRAIKPTFFLEALDRIRHHQRQGHLTVIASGSQLIITRAVADYLGMDLAIGTQVEYENGRATGRMIGHPVFGTGKAAMVQAALRQRAIDWERSWAYANEMVDRHTLELVGNPVAVNPDAELKQLARTHDWEIVEWTKQRGRRRS